MAVNTSLLRDKYTQRLAFLDEFKRHPRKRQAKARQLADHMARAFLSPGKDAKRDRLADKKYLQMIGSRREFTLICIVQRLQDDTRFASVMARHSPQALFDMISTNTVSTERLDMEYREKCLEAEMKHTCNRATDAWGNFHEVYRFILDFLTRLFAGSNRLENEALQIVINAKMPAFFSGRMNFLSKHTIQKPRFQAILKERGLVGDNGGLVIAAADEQTIPLDGRDSIPTSRIKAKRTTTRGKASDCAKLHRADFGRFAPFAVQQTLQDMFPREDFAVEVNSVFVRRTAEQFLDDQSMKQNELLDTLKWMKSDGDVRWDDAIDEAQIRRGIDCSKEVAFSIVKRNNPDCHFELNRTLSDQLHLSQLKPSLYLAVVGYMASPLAFKNINYIGHMTADYIHLMLDLGAADVRNGRKLANTFVHIVQSADSKCDGSRDARMANRIVHVGWLEECRKCDGLAPFEPFLVKCINAKDMSVDPDQADDDSRGSPKRRLEEAEADLPQRKRVRVNAVVDDSPFGTLNHGRMPRQTRVSMMDVEQSSWENSTPPFSRSDNHFDCQSAMSRMTPRQPVLDAWPSDPSSSWEFSQWSPTSATSHGLDVGQVPGVYPMNDRFAVDNQTVFHRPPLQLDNTSNCERLVWRRELSQTRSFHQTDYLEDSLFVEMNQCEDDVAAVHDMEMSEMALLQHASQVLGPYSVWNDAFCEGDQTVFNRDPLQLGGTPNQEPFSSSPSRPFPRMNYLDDSFSLEMQRDNDVAAVQDMEMAALTPMQNRSFGNVGLPFQCPVMPPQVDSSWNVSPHWLNESTGQAQPPWY